MRFKDNFNSAIFSLYINKTRAILTALGIIIGILAVILVISIGKGSESIILKEVQAMGSKTIVIKAGKESTGLSPTSATMYFTKTLKNDDLIALKTIKNIVKIAPIIFSSGDVNYKDKKYYSEFMGTTREGAEILNIPLKNGRYANEDEVLANARVVILGAGIVKNLFPITNPLGENIKILNQNYKIVGTLFPKGSVAFVDIDNKIYMPYTTAQKLILGIDYFHSIALEVGNENEVPQTVKQIKNILRRQHKITDPANDDFHVITQEDAAKRVGIIGSTLTAFLISIAIISLIVGGIGIMNIMLVAVKERVREIGLRKAIGASKKNILTQFLLEAMILSVLGGVIGLILGVFLSWIVSVSLSSYLGYNWPLIIPLWVVILSFLVSALIGIVFGYYPAKQAAKLDPIVALRYE